MPTIVHFDGPADDLFRARKYHSELCGWNLYTAPGFPDFFLMETSGLDRKSSNGGGTGKRGSPDKRIRIDIGIPDIDEYKERGRELDGTGVVPEMSVPAFGYPAICMDTEVYLFGLLQVNAGPAQIIRSNHGGRIGKCEG